MPKPDVPSTLTGVTGQLALPASLLVSANKPGPEILTFESLEGQQSPCSFCQSLCDTLLSLRGRESDLHEVHLGKRFFLDVWHTSQICFICKVLVSTVAYAPQYKWLKIIRSKMHFRLVRPPRLGLSVELHVELYAMKNNHPVSKEENLLAPWLLSGVFKDALAPNTKPVLTPKGEHFEFWTKGFERRPQACLNMEQVFRCEVDDLADWKRQLPGDIRRLDARVNFDLLRYWNSMCADIGYTCRYSDQIVVEERHVSTIRLVDLQRHCLVDAPISSPYVALSYVWGHERTNGMMLLKHNLGLCYLEDTLFGTVPRTISDSFEVARQLGYRYLFVDRLCIVQDDEGDQATYVEAMDLIFGLAMLTIIAAAGRSASAGLPGVNDTPRTAIDRCRLSLPDGSYLSRIEASERRPETLVQRQLSASVWASRAWTMQEGLLTARTLIFTDQQAFWSCRHRCCSEDIALEAVEIHEEADVAEGLMVRGEAVEGLSSLLKLCTVSKRICSLIAAYTRRDLTFPNDRLRAFQGILSAYANVNKSWSFHHGLSMPAFLLELTWGIVPQDDTNDQGSFAGITSESLGSAISKFPSYSWLSVNCEVVWEYDTHDPETSILSSPSALTTSFYRTDSSGELTLVWLEKRPLTRRNRGALHRGCYIGLMELAGSLVSEEGAERAILFGAYQIPCRLSFVQARRHQPPSIYLELENGTTLSERVGWQQRPDRACVGKPLGIVVLGETAKLENAGQRRSRVECILVEWRGKLAYRVGKFTSRDFTKAHMWDGLVFDAIALN